MKSQESRNLVPKVFPPRFSSFLYKNNLYKIYFKKLAGGGGLLGYDFGGYVPPGFQNLDSVLKKLSSLETGQFLIRRSVNLTLLNAFSRAGTGLLSRVNQ